MNWKIEGKKGNGKSGAVTLIGQPTEDRVRAHMKATHPDFKVDKVTALDGNLQPITKAEAALLAETPAGEPTPTTKAAGKGK